MKKTRKLIPALAMLLISAVMLSTASYAWFSMNSEVTAGTMAVKATTDANLYIAKGASVGIDSITGTSVDDLNVNNDSILPTDLSDDEGTVTMRVADAYSVEPTVGTAGSASTWTTIGTLTETTATSAGSHNLNNYCAYAYVTIARKATNPKTFELTPTCTVTIGSGTSDLNKALRVGIIINGKLYESDDMNTATGTITFDFDPITGLEDNKAYSACLLFWYEGEDSDCFVNNAISLTSNSAAWKFVSANETP